jgi:hypothetical protein
MTDAKPKLIEITPKFLGEQKKKKPSACKLQIRPFDQRTLEAWVR